ncbi:MAG: hypothetical protein NC299_08435 [Lachnospiraceae bacterium]|nr:hypothetical protein [Ruminococcus sp.]MCM1275380.1 hypothetical protein [Lachnospiraceae bacterium]
MPLPLILGIGAAIAGVAGVVSGAAGISLTKDANDTMNRAKNKYNSAQRKIDEASKTATDKMDELGNLEVEIIASFQRFLDAFEKVKNRPEIEEIDTKAANIPKISLSELKDASIGASALASSLASAAVGTAGGFAAYGGILSAALTFGTATTGTAISTLSGAAATNAAMAFLGGGALTAAGGLGVAGGTALLADAATGVGLLVGGFALGLAGGAMSSKADEAYSQACDAEEKADKACGYLHELQDYTNKYIISLNKVNTPYLSLLERFEEIVNTKRDYNYFTASEKMLTENLVLLIGLLYSMCKVQLVLKSDNENDMNTVNKNGVDSAIQNADDALYDIA